jgi:hypothetical protein
VRAFEPSLNHNCQADKVSRQLKFRVNIRRKGRVSRASDNSTHGGRFVLFVLTTQRELGSDVDSITAMGMHALPNMEEYKHLLAMGSDDSETGSVEYAPKPELIPRPFRQHPKWAYLYFGCLHLILLGISVRLYVDPTSIHTCSEKDIYSKSRGFIIHDDSVLICIPSPRVYSNRI